MATELTREYTAREEIMPVLAVSVLLNLVGPYLNAHVLGIPHVFLDMGGTCLAAMLLGPWWAAAVGVLSNAFNGLAFTSYFPFAVVNMLGGLAWGYWFRAYGLRYRIFAPPSLQLFKDLTKFYLMMVLVGTLVCGPLSALVKLLLYPLAGLPLHYNKPIYLNAMSLLANQGVPHPDLLALLGVDLFRDLQDKLLSLPISIFFARSMGAVALSVFSVAGRQWRLLDRLKTDALSIIFFVATLFVYLLVGRLTNPSIQFEGAAQAIPWLREPQVIALLYSPIIIGVLAFIFLSLDDVSAVGRMAEELRKLRASLYRRLRRPLKASFSRRVSHYSRWLPHMRSVYGFMGLILAWPSRNLLAEFGQAIPSSLYLGGMVVTSGLFFRDSREFRRGLYRAAGSLAAIDRWQQVPVQAGHAPEVLQVLGDALSDQLTSLDEPARSRERLVYAPFYNTAEDGVLAELRQQHGCDRLLAFAPGEARTLDSADVRVISEVLAYTRIKGCIVLANLPVFSGPEALTAFRQLQGTQFLFLSWHDLERLLECRAQGQDPDPILMHGLLLATEKLAPDETAVKAWSFGHAPVQELSQRALPALKHVIDGLPPGRLVVDFGAGRGRHSLYALQHRHQVVAVENKHKAFQDLQMNVQHLEHLADAARLLETDYMQVRPQDIDNLDLLVITGVLQHATDKPDLQRRLEFLGEVSASPGAMIYIEMLFDMRFDGRERPGRVKIAPAEFEQLLAEVYPDDAWQLGRVTGPAYSLIDCSGGGRSFFSDVQIVEQTACEYLLTRRIKP